MYQTLVARARELAQVGRTLFALAGSLAQGAVAPAAQALEAVLARLLPVALDFLARTFGLDKLPRLLRLGLEALRRPGSGLPSPECCWRPYPPRWARLKPPPCSGLSARAAAY